MIDEETTKYSFDTCITNYDIKNVKSLIKPTYIESNFQSEVSSFLKNKELSLLLCGDSLNVLKELPAHSVDCAVTSVMV